MNARRYALPMGTVSFLLTDIEGSTRAWQSQAEEMALAVARQHDILDEAIAQHGGVRPGEQGEGDSVVGAFSRASDAVLAAAEAQRRLQREPWPTSEPLRVRMAVHTGEARLRGDDNYVGQAIIRTARLRAIGHGGQVVVSQAARDLTIDQLGAGVGFVDLGEHRLKDLARPEHVWQLVADGLDQSFAPLRSLDAVTNNLPISLSTFIGRADDVLAMTRLLHEHRLLTTTGPGGIGKTRLALQVAAEVAERFPGGLWWVDLSPMSAPEVERAVATSVGIVDTADGRVIEHLASRLSGGPTLLLLDNCEHVLDDAGTLVHSLLSRCPQLCVLATSRTALELPGEVTWRVPPMALPTAVEAFAETPVSLAAFDAVHLFTTRARAVRPGFKIDDETGPMVAEICQRLDGIPLALELAAARCRSSSLRQILDGLGDALHMLTGGTRVVIPRQQTLEASIAWSHALLPPRQQVALRRLAVFRGGCTVHAAEELLAGDEIDRYDVLDVLDRLVQQSLIVAEERRSETRYRFLETVRQFASRRLHEAGEADAVEARYVQWAETFLTELSPRLFGVEQIEALDAFEDELRNITAALEQLRVRPDGPARLCRLAVPLVSAALSRDVAAALYPLVEVSLGDLDALSANEHGAARLLRGGLASSVGLFNEALADLDRAVDALAEPTPARHLAIVMLAIGSLLGGSRPDDRLAALLAELAASGDAYFVEQAAKLATVLELTRGSIHTALSLHQQHAATLASSDSSPEGLGEHLKWGSYLHYLRGELGVAHVLADRSYELLERTYSGARLFMSHRLLARVCLATGRDHAMLRGLAEQLERAHAGDRKSVAYLADALGVDHHRRGELAEARAVLEPFVARCVEQRAWWLAVDAGCHLLPVLDGLGDEAATTALIATIRRCDHNGSLVGATGLTAIAEARLALRSGDASRAENLLHDALSSLEETGVAVHVPLALQHLAAVAARLRSGERAARLLGAVARHRSEAGFGPRPAPYDAEHAEVLAAVELLLGAERLAELFAEGEALSIDEAVVYARRTRGERRRPSYGWDALTPTEQQVADLVAEGLSNADVGARLLMGAETVKTHLSRVFTKLSIRRRSELARLAYERRAEQAAGAQPDGSRSTGPDE